MASALIQTLQAALEVSVCFLPRSSAKADGLPTASCLPYLGVRVSLPANRGREGELGWDTHNSTRSPIDQPGTPAASPVQSDRLWARDEISPANRAMLVGLVAMAGELPNIPERTPYPEARKKLLSLGWEPVPSRTTCPPDVHECKTYPETLFCSGSGLARCAFRWSKSGALIEIDTFRAEERFVDRIRCRTGCP